MAFEWAKKAANDNLTRGELDAQRLVRENKLREYRLFTDTVRKWLNTRYNEIQPEHSPGMTEAQRMLIATGLESMQKGLAMTEQDVRFAEEHADDIEAYNRAKHSRDILYAAYIEAEFHL